MSYVLVLYVQSSTRTSWNARKRRMLSRDATSRLCKAPSSAHSYSQWASGLARSSSISVCAAERRSRWLARCRWMQLLTSLTVKHAPGNWSVITR